MAILSLPRPRLGGAASSEWAGPLLALVAFLLFSLMDAVVKTLAVRYPAPEIVLGNGLVMLMVVAAMTLRRGGLAHLRTRRPGLQLLRGLASTLAATAAFFAFSRIPLADAYAIIFTTPLLVTLLSVPFLGEVVGWRRTAAVVVGFMGVMIMLQPGQGELGAGNLAALIAAFGAATGIIVMRKLATSESTVSIALYSNLTVVIALGLPLPAYGVMPTAADLGLFLLSGGLGSAALLLLISAYRLAPAALVAPLQYSQMIWGVLLGILIFGDLPGLHVLIGGAIVAASGLFTLYRQRVVRAERAAVAVEDAAAS
ncbi:MAG TPA: DMT family transporter [Geminicoccaceae bacterium]